MMLKHGSDAEQKFKCKEEDCGKRFIDQKKLDNHVKNTHTDEEVECELYGAKMKPISMYHHVRNACTKNPDVRIGKRVQCPHCKSTPRRQNFGRHMKAHKRNNEIASMLESLESLETVDELTVKSAVTMPAHQISAQNLDLSSSRYGGMSWTAGELHYEKLESSFKRSWGRVGDSCHLPLFPTHSDFKSQPTAISSDNAMPEIRMRSDKRIIESCFSTSLNSTRVTATITMSGTYLDSCYWSALKPGSLNINPIYIIPNYLEPGSIFRFCCDPDPQYRRSRQVVPFIYWRRPPLFRPVSYIVFIYQHQLTWGVP